MKTQTLLLKFAILMLTALTLGIGSVHAQEVKRKFGQPITVYKTPTCGCCSSWVDYLKTNGFRVETHDLNNLDGIKAQYGLTEPRLKSCHTAIVDGYVVEGHVPANDIWRLLSERPDVVGITAPGMPQMSPGMMSAKPEGYDVLSFDKENKTDLFSRY
jgi:hypothetical protein